jgi:hypothetical protein
LLRRDIVGISALKTPREQFATYASKPAKK